MKRRTFKVPRYRAGKLPWKAVLAACFLLCFFTGILAANWAGREKLIQYGMLNEYYVGQLAYADMDAGGYFRYLFGQRVCKFAGVVIFGFTGFGAAALLLVVGWYAFSLGYLFVNALVCMGFQGMLLVLVSLFPHYLCYGLAYIRLGAGILGGKGVQREPEWKKWSDMRAAQFALAALCLLAGIWMESYINPGLLKSFIRRI